MSAAAIGAGVDLWIGNQEVLTVTVSRDSRVFPVDPRHCRNLHSMIHDMARAAQAVIYHAQNDASTDTEFALGPLDGLLAGIILLSQLSEGVRLELERPAVEEAA